jgi:hypothetical protein
VTSTERTPRVPTAASTPSAVPRGMQRATSATGAAGTASAGPTGAVSVHAGAPPARTTVAR